MLAASYNESNESDTGPGKEPTIELELPMTKARNWIVRRAKSPPAVINQ